MKILITGGAGHIGSFLIKRLCNLSIIKKIYVIDAYKEENFYSLFNLNSRKILKIYQDILDIDFKDFSKVDIVIHLAATTNAATSFENKKSIFNNFLITKKIVHYCNSTKATLIFPPEVSSQMYLLTDFISALIFPPLVFAPILPSMPYNLIFPPQVEH